MVKDNKHILLISILVLILYISSALSFLIIFSTSNYSFNNTNYIPFLSSKTNLQDGRYYSAQYYDGYSIKGLETTRGIKTYLSWDGNYNPEISKIIKYYDQSYFNQTNNKNYIRYIADMGKFKVEFTNFTNEIITAKFSFKQRPSEIGLYNWNTKTYISKENVSKANEIIPNYQNKTLTYTEIFTNTDVQFISNTTHLKEIFINNASVFWPYPSGWVPSDTYLIILIKLYDFNGVELYDNDGKIISSKVVNGTIRLLSTELGQELMAYLPVGEAYSLFTDNEIHYTPVKGRIIIKNNEIYYVSAIDYEFVVHTQRSGNLYIDPTWSIGKDGNAWADCIFYNTMENQTTGYVQLYPINNSGYIISPIEQAQLQWKRIKYEGILNGGSIDIYWNGSQNQEDWELNIIKINAEPNTSYYLPIPSKYGSWRFILHGISIPFITPLIYNITVFNDPPNADDFIYYKEIEIDSSKVMGLSVLYNFPLLININDADLQTNTQSDGDDIAFSNDTAWLDHEIEYWNGSQSNNLVAWIRIPSLNPIVNTTIFIYYGNSTMESQQNPSGVWDTQYMGVWHLGEDLGNAEDSTIWDTDGVSSGGVIKGVSGKIGNAFDFTRITTGTVSMGNPIDEHLEFLDGQDFTISFWLDLDFFYFYDCPIVSKKASAATSSVGYEVYMWDDTRGVSRYRVSDGTDFFGITTINDTLGAGWKYIVATFNESSSSDSTIFLDGLDNKSAEAGVIENVGNLFNSLNFRLNGYSVAWYEDMLDMVLDDVRISRGLYTPDWVLTEFNNQNDPSTFYIIGTEIGVPPTPFISIPLSFDSIMSMIILFILITIMLVIYFKMKIFLLILGIYLFSLVIGVMSLSQYLLFNPYIQTFFIIFQTIIFLITVIELYNKR